MGNLISCFTQQTPDSTQSGLSEPLLKKCVSSPKSPEQDFYGRFGEEKLPLVFKDETSTSEINGLRQPKFDTCIEEETSQNENGMIEIFNFILIKSNGPILDYRKSLQLKCVMFPQLDNIYIIHQHHGKYDEYHITFESMLPYSLKMENYRKFLNNEISREDFRKYLKKNFPKYYKNLWESFSNEQLTSFRLYE
jgi:hypothetical protein